MSYEMTIRGLSFEDKETLTELLTVDQGSFEFMDFTVREKHDGT